MKEIVISSDLKEYIKKQTQTDGEELKIACQYFALNVVGAFSTRRTLEHYSSYSDTKTPLKNIFLKENFSIKQETLNKWDELLGDRIDEIKLVATTERITGFEERYLFLEWYLGLEKKCCYCEVTENQLEKYFNNKDSQVLAAYNRARGHRLEIERIITAPKEKNVYNKENCALVCYVCNNAKSDFISPLDFMPIAKGINEFWQSLAEKKDIKIDPFDEDAYLEKFKNR